MSLHTVFSRLVRPRLRGWIGFALAALLAAGDGSDASATESPVPNGSFESGLSWPWGTGQSADGRPVWWTVGNCQAIATVDDQIYQDGRRSLHISNQSARSPNVYGTTQQAVQIVPGDRYRISLWARTRGLASDGAVSIAVDDRWTVRPIHLPRGSHDWRYFVGEFSLPGNTAQLRILCEDRGEAWIDDIRIEHVTSETAARGHAAGDNNGDGDSRLPSVPEPADPLARSLGLTPENGSLPVWSRGGETDRQQLGQVVRAVQEGVLLVGDAKRGFGTAFVISRKHRLLATNAHVADILHRAGSMLAILNGSTTTWQVERVWYHPGVLREVGSESILLARSPDPRDGRVNSLSPDVAVLQLRHGPELPVEFKLATPDEARNVFAQPIAMIGFPGHDTRWPAPGRTVRATYHDGVVSRVTDFQMDPGAPVEELQFLQHTASGFGGFSGSPIFLPNGHVVAIHNSGRGVNDRGMYANISHGVRIDCLWELLAYHGLEDRVAVPVSKSSLNLARYARPDPKLERFRSAVSLVEQATALVLREEYAEAVAACTRAIQQAPGFWRAYDVRMTAHGNYAVQYQQRLAASVFREQVEASLKDGRKLLQLAPSNPAFLVRYAWALSNYSVGKAQEGRNAEAEADRKKVIAILRRLLASHNLDTVMRSEVLDILAMTSMNLKLARGNHDIAEELALNAEAIRLRPNSPALHQNRAGMLSAVGRHKEAQAVRERERQLRQIAAQQH